MKNTLLLPRKCRLIGSILLPLAIAWLVAGYFGQHSVFPFLQYNMKGTGHDIFSSDLIFSKGFSADFNGELSILFTLVCLFMIAFSREKIEDEFVSMVRLKALQISVYVSYAVFALVSIFIYGFTFLYVIYANIFTVLLIFIFVFQFHIYRNSRTLKSKTS